MFNRIPPKVTWRGLAQVADLAALLADLALLDEALEWEADEERDGSDIPARLTEALHDLGHILIDMTIEEVTELVEAEADETDPAGLAGFPDATEGQRAVVALMRLNAASLPLGNG